MSVEIPHPLLKGFGLLVSILLMNGCGGSDHSPALADNCMGTDNLMQTDTDNDGLVNDCDMNDDGDGFDDQDDPAPLDNSVPGAVSAQTFVTPIGGVAFEDWTIVNYVDLDSSPNVVDWNGGNYTYDGHNAIDFTLPNFAAMDAGIPVLAALAGTVISVHEGEFDRWSRANPNTTSALPNSIVVDHDNGVVTEYLHLRMNSISVNTGDIVSAGQQIGLVGSSGNSTDAHLHFAVYKNSIPVETYRSPENWWQKPLVYSGWVSGALDFGVTDRLPTVDDFVERPISHPMFDIQNTDVQQVVSWANIHGFSDGDTVDYYFNEPDGDLFTHLTWTTGQIRYGWWTAAIELTVNSELGMWRIEGQLNGKTFLQDSFLVFDSSTDG